MKLRPVVSCINSLTSIFSNWLDFRMKQLLHLIPSYIRDSKALLIDLKSLHIPPGVKMFTADASAMYTNIDSNTGIQAISDLITTHQSSIPPDFPTDFFLTTLKIVMDSNIFSFGDTFWRQLKGTAMGTPAAPLYSILSYGQHENTQILNRYQPNILYYKRYIDDIFCLWHETPDNQWEHLKLSLNGFGDLKWNIENLSDKTTFLDLQLTIKNNNIQSSTYQKPMNLYTYIPSLSAHPKSCFKGLIKGELLRYWLQNSEEKDFISTTSLFIHRLLARGHRLNEIIPLLQTAAA